MSIQKDTWTAFKNQLRNDTALSAYVNRFKFNRQEEIFNESMFPLVVCYIPAIVEEEYIGIPKQKLAKLTIECYGKIHATAGDDLEDEVLVIDAHLKNAIEKNLTMSGVCVQINLSDSTFEMLDKEYIETHFTARVTLQRFTAGAR